MSPNSSCTSSAAERPPQDPPTRHKSRVGETTDMNGLLPFGLPISSLSDPQWVHDGAELSLIVDPEMAHPHNPDRPAPLIWTSIEERNSYCDRGHYLVRIHFGVEIDDADMRPNYYMRLEVAKTETVEWLLWRMKKVRAEPYGAIRSIDLLKGGGA